MTTYAGNRKFIRSDASAVVRLNVEDVMALTDYAEVLKDINAIFDICAGEVTTRIKANSVKKRDGLLVVEDFRSGSIELVTNAYFSGVVSGVVANIVFALFIHVMKRISGKALDRDEAPPEEMSSTEISGERLREAAQKAIVKSSPKRKSLSQKHKTYGLTISVTFNTRRYEVLS